MYAYLRTYKFVKDIYAKWLGDVPYLLNIAQKSWRLTLALVLSIYAALLRGILFIHPARPG